MDNQENSLRSKEEETTETVSHLNPSIFWIFLTIALLTLIFGLFTIASVLIDRIQHSQLNYPDALIIGISLIFGGIILLGGSIIMKNWAPLPQIEAKEEPSDLKD
jgi:succinate dehydrogenase/fumarate reductase cytochrome b subunit